ncbi:MAG: acetate/propionate family kinase [Bacteroidetes bacterium]|nr:acetate/propionate family kinase [Bacteroidota bacterium]
MSAMTEATPHALLILNAGSSSIKFGIYHGIALAPLLSGSIGRRGDASYLTFTDRTLAESAEQREQWDQGKAISHLVAWLARWAGSRGIGLCAVGHRIVSAFHYTEPVIIAKDVLDDIASSGAADPEHSLVILKLIRASEAHFTGIPQVAMFDSAFHSALPALARILPVPEVYRRRGIRRYGYHGLSYTGIMAWIKATYGQKAHDSKVIIAHLGNGASLAAVSHGISIDTTMSYSPTGGIPMSTRSGDLDPSVLLDMMSEGSMDLDEMVTVLNNESGLKAISGTTGDISELLKNEKNDPSARAAVDYFCYHVRKAIGAYAAALGGVDILVFTGGIGEHLPEIRSRICEGLSYMGLQIDELKNTSGVHLVSQEGGKALILALASQEEATMARLLRDFISDKG